VFQQKPRNMITEGSQFAVIVEKKSMGGEMSFRPLMRPRRSFTSLFSHPGDKF
jgi:hypothetical protein